MGSRPPLRMCSQPCQPNHEKHYAEYIPMQWTLKQIRSAIPPHLFVRDTKFALMYATRDLAIASILWYAATFIDPVFQDFRLLPSITLRSKTAEVARRAVWLVYWWFQGLTFTGLWIIGHECGHNSFSPSKTLCNVVGYIFHTALWTPYFSWKFSHHRHHSHHASMEKDQIYIPSTRSQLGLPKSQSSVDYEEYFGDTPVYTMFTLLRRQLIGFPVYLLTNASGQKHYPRWTNHLNPNAVIFSSSQRRAIILSDIGLFFMALLVTYTCSIFGAASVIKYYGVPWMAVTHWVTMITYLQHTDPQIPHYRKGAWTFPRGAVATVDRDFLGWQGRFFFHDVAHYHVIHHFFPQMPFYHGEEATKYLKEFIGEYYQYSNEPVFKKLWENYNFCQFVEDEGDIVFFKNKEGKGFR